ncbi:MAG: hypothetical protein RBT45_01120 [Acholeplasmataceae bacterium]|jgi:hypothetical protein|nr:hypothetical protein [Acholeplasmataceae bacterium]
MNEHPKVTKFKKYQVLLFKGTVSILILSSLLAIIGYMLVKAVTPAPGVIIYLATIVLYYHFAHFIMSLSFVVYYMAKIRNKLGKTKILKSIVSILFTPVSFLIIYFAVFLLAVSSCAD